MTDNSGTGSERAGSEQASNTHSSDITHSGSSPSRRLGFDPNESTDFSVPSEINLEDRPSLIQWQYLPGGERLPQLFKYVPHLQDRDPPPLSLSAPIQTDTLCVQIAREARTAQLESVLLKQKADTLQNEKDLLEWHLANNSKSNQVQRGHLSNARKSQYELEEKIEATTVKLDAAHLLHNSLVADVMRSEKDLASVQEKLDAEEAAFNEVASRKRDYLADIAMERRQADHERLLRLHQWKKLNRAANVDRKHHIKYDLGANLDYLVLEAYNQVKQFKEADIAALADVTGAAREVIEQDANEINPLEDYESVIDEESSVGNRRTESRTQSSAATPSS